MVHADHLELLFDEVLLDADSSRCFQARRRLIGTVNFDKGADRVDRAAFAASIERVAKLLQQPAKSGNEPAAVLHGYADHDEADTANAARELSERRALFVKTMLVERGVPESRARIEPHGWELSPSPIRTTDLLPPHRSVEISHNGTPPSEATLAESAPVEPAVFRDLKDKVKKMGGSAPTAPDSKLGPRVSVSVGDSDGTTDIALDVDSSGSDAVKLHRYFLGGLASGCIFNVGQY